MMLYLWLSVCLYILYIFLHHIYIFKHIINIYSICYDKIYMLILDIYYWFVYLDYLFMQTYKNWKKNIINAYILYTKLVYKS